jgi:hypothetical protein
LSLKAHFPFSTIGLRTNIPMPFLRGVQVRMSCPDKNGFAFRVLFTLALYYVSHHGMMILNLAFLISSDIIT